MNNENILNDSEESPLIVTLEDEDGVEHLFELLDSYTLNDVEYRALVPYFETEQDLIESDGELLVLKVVNQDGNDYLNIIEDKEEFDKITKIFIDRLSDTFDFID